MSNLTQDLFLPWFDYDRDAGKIYWTSTPPRKSFSTKRFFSIWMSCLSGKEAGSRTIDRSGVSYLRVKLQGKQYLVHRVIYTLEHGFISDDAFIDHKDGDGLNNRISNLRIASRFQNMSNRQLNLNNSSGFTGVSKHPGGKWYAQGSKSGKRVSIGYFNSKQEAIDARRAWEISNPVLSSRHGKKRRLSQ